MKTNLDINKANFYVAPDGNDQNPGTKEKPFATLDQARLTVRNYKNDNQQEDILVLFREGTYQFTETVNFTLEDSADEGQTITYAAFPGENPVFSSGVSITNWEKLEQDIVPEGLSSELQDKIWVADVPEKLDKFFTLYQGQKRLPRARTEGFVPDIEREEKVDKCTLKYPQGKMKKWSNFNDAEVLVRPNSAWCMNVLPLDSIDEDQCKAYTSVPATYPMKQVRWAEAYGDAVKKNGSVWIENIFEALNKPGEWVLDSENKKIYLWPKGEKPGDDIVAPLLTELIKVEGEINYNDPVDVPVKNLVFTGFTFTHADRFQWDKDHQGWGLQHDWEMFDKPTALVRFRGAENCIINDCNFSNSGGTGIRLDLHCKNNQIKNSIFANLGNVGILLAGYGPGTKDVNKNNKIINNHIHHIGEILWHAVGIFIWQSGENEVINNFIHDTPYTGLVVSGRINWDPEGKRECSKIIRWNEVNEIVDETPVDDDTIGNWIKRERFLHGRKNIIESNEMTRVMQVLGDGNCIYVSGTGKDNIVRNNYLHDCLSQSMGAAIRCDDDQHLTLIENNIIYRNGGSGNGIAIKGVNDIINNFIIDLRPVTHHRGYISLEYMPVNNSIIQKNVIYSKREDTKIYGQNGLDGSKNILKYCNVDYNIYFNQADDQWGENHFDEERKHGVDIFSINADPGFSNIDKQNFDFKDDSPCDELGINSGKIIFYFH